MFTQSLLGSHRHFILALKMKHKFTHTSSSCCCLSERPSHVFISVCLTVASQHENTASALVCQLVWMGLKMVSLSQQAQIPSQIAWGCTAYRRPPSDSQSRKRIWNIQQVQSAASVTSFREAWGKSCSLCWPGISSCSGEGQTLISKMVTTQLHRLNVQLQSEDLA